MVLQKKGMFKIFSRVVLILIIGSLTNCLRSYKVFEIEIEKVCIKCDGIDKFKCGIFNINSWDHAIGVCVIPDFQNENIDFKLENIYVTLKAYKGTKIIKDDFKLKNIEVSISQTTKYSKNRDITSTFESMSEIPVNFRCKRDSSIWIRYRINYILDKQIFEEANEFQAQIEIEYFKNGLFKKDAYRTELRSKRHWNVKLKDGYLF